MRDVNEDVYYIEAIGEAATRIGRTMISPNLPPTPFTETEYKRHQRVIEFYEGEGIILVTSPGSRDAIMKAAEIEAEQERTANIEAANTGPPDPVLRKRGHSIPESVADAPPPPKGNISTFAAPAPPAAVDETPESFKCIVLAKGSGKRCKNDAIGDLLVCGVHFRLLEKGSVLKDASGRIISKDGRSLEPKKKGS